MKLSNKLIIASACLCIVSVALFSSSFLKSSPKSPLPDTGEAPRVNETKNTTRTESNISEPVTKKEASLRYVIKTDNGKICAYMLYDNKEPLLWDSTDIPPTLTNDEKSALEQGIYTDSFEEMCLYYESYAS